MNTPTVKKLIRAAIAAFCYCAELHEWLWHYTQARPFQGFGRKCDEPHAGDCSSYISLVFNFAMHKVGAYLADPLGFNYSGWGWTGSLITWLIRYGSRAPVGKYLVGDIAIYGESSARTEHTTVCRKAGTTATAIFSSFGKEAGPVRTKLHYRPDLIGVWRHPGLR